MGRMEDSKSRARHNSNHHSTSAKERQQQLVAFFVVGLCAGIIISERLYIRSSRAALQNNGQPVTVPDTPQAQLGHRFMRGGGRSSVAKAAAGSAASTVVSRAAVAGALAAEVAAAEAAAVAAISEQLVRTDPQLRELEAYLRKVRHAVWHVQGAQKQTCAGCAHTAPAALPRPPLGLAWGQSSIR